MIWHTYLRFATSEDGPMWALLIVCGLVGLLLFLQSGRGA